MIRVHLDIAVAVYLGVSIAVLSLWMALERRRRPSRTFGRTDALWECPICFSVYIDSRSESISACPVCGALHKRGETGVQYSGGKKRSDAQEPQASG